MVKRAKAVNHRVGIHASDAVVPRTPGSSTLIAAPSARPIRAGERITTVIVAAERLVGEALRALLASERDVYIVGEAVQWSAAIEMIQKKKPHVVVFDLTVPDVDYAEALSLIKRHSPESRILLLLASADAAGVRRALKAGANGYVSKSASLADLTKAICGVHRGEVWVERKLLSDIVLRLAGGTSRRASEKKGERLTSRERQILRVLASGGTNRHIAEALFISEKTVKTHLNNIFRKLNVTRRLQAVLYALSHGLREH